MKKSMIEKYKNIIFRVNGGIGKNIMATAVIRNLKQMYPDKNIYVVAGFPDIFLYNPYVKKVYGFDKAQNLYEDYIDRYSANNPDQTLILETEPYTHPEYLCGDKHLVNAWCELFDIECTSIKPELYFTKNEKDMAQSYVNKFSNPMIIFQYIGGKIPINESEQERIGAESGMYRRSLRDKVVQQVTDELIKDGYMVGSVCAPTQFSPKGSERIYFHLRLTLAILPYVQGVIAIDSFIQHACAALDIPALVLWAGTSPDKLGYNLHKNIRRNSCATPECHRPNSFAHDITANGNIWDCPYGDVCRDYEASNIIKDYKDMKGKSYSEIVETFKAEKQKLANSIPQPVKGLGQICPSHNHGG